MAFLNLAFFFSSRDFFGAIFGGISGWVIVADKENPIVLSGIKFVNNDGATIWQTLPLQPTTQVGRFYRAYVGSGTGSRSDYLRFIFSNYKRIYPTIEKGTLPHEKRLGKFSYPPHSLVKSNAKDYVGVFSPERLRSIRFEKEYYDWEGELLKRDISTSITVN